MTGPAILNILAPTPKTKPSFLNSIAGDTTAFAKPVIGTYVYSFYILKTYKLYDYKKVDNYLHLL